MLAYNKVEREEQSEVCAAHDLALISIIVFRLKWKYQKEGDNTNALDVMQSLVSTKSAGPFRESITRRLKEG